MGTLTANDAIAARRVFPPFFVNCPHWDYKQCNSDEIGKFPYIHGIGADRDKLDDDFDDFHPGGRRWPQEEQGNNDGTSLKSIL